MVISCDLDTTLVKLHEHVFFIANKHTGCKFNAKDIIKFSLDEYPEDFRSKLIKLFADKRVMGGLKPIIGCSEKLKEWKKQGHKTLIVTARPESLRECTTRLIERKFEAAYRVVLVGWGSDKEEVFRNEKVDIVIDDGPHCINAALRVGVPIIYMICNKYTKYNWHLKENKKIRIVKSVADIRLED